MARAFRKKRRQSRPPTKSIWCLPTMTWLSPIYRRTVTAAARRYLGPHIFDRVLRRERHRPSLTKPYHSHDDDRHSERMNQTIKEASVKIFHCPSLERFRTSARRQGLQTAKPSAGTLSNAAAKSQSSSTGTRKIPCAIDKALYAPRNRIGRFFQSCEELTPRRPRRPPCQKQKQSRFPGRVQNLNFYSPIKKVNCSS